MRRLRFSLPILVLLAAMPVAGQVPDIRTELLGRGAPQDFADQVAALVEAAGGQGLPLAPLVDKALEGWAKRGRVPPARVLNVLEQLTSRLGEARDLVVASGLADAPGPVVAAAAEGLGRGLTREDVESLIGAAPTPEAAATGISIASALGGQGLDRAAAVQAVRDAHGQGQSPGQLLELPSVVAGLIAKGVPMSEVAQMVLQGQGLPSPAGVGGGPGAGAGRPPIVPPGRGVDRNNRGRGRSGNG